MARYPTVRDTNKLLDPSNPNYGLLLAAITNLSNKEDDFYENRRRVFDQYDFGGFDESVEQVEAKYDTEIGDEPWNYKDDFDDIDPDRQNGGGAKRLVQYTFDLSGITAGFADSTLVVENGEDDDGDYCGNEKYVIPENRKDDDCDSDPALRVLDYETGRGKGQIDCLYKGLAAFKDNDDQVSTNYYVQGEDDDDGDEVFEEQAVFRGFGEIPFAWKEKDGYTKRQLSSMNAAGAKYEELVRPAITQYQNALTAYGEYNGGDLGYEEHLSTDTEFPWEGLVGNQITYNRPEDLPGTLVRQARGVLAPEEDI